MAPTIPNYVFASLAVAIGGLLNGMDTGSIGAVVTMLQFEDSIGKLSATLLGFTVSLIMLTGAIPAIFAGQLAEKYGRLKVIMLGVSIFIIGASLQGSATGLSMFLTGRALSGLGEGIYLSPMSVYVCEIAPVRHRGTLAGLPQFLATTGVCFGYFVCYGSVHIQSSMAWRLPFILQAVISVFLVGLCFKLPDSPRWLIHHGRRSEAIHALQKLDFGMAEAEKDILNAQNEQNTILSAWQGFLLLFRRGYLSRTVLALFILGMVQLSGIDGVLYFAPVLFKQAGLQAQTASFLASGLSAILMLVVSVPAFLFADRWGRRISAISGGTILAFCMLLIGTLYASDSVHAHGFARWIVIAAVFVFSLTYCATWGIVGKIYASEIQPAHTRAAANCVATGLGFFTNWLVAILTPIMLNKSAYGAYFLFGGLALGTVAVLAVCMPETRGRSLENIQEAFHHQAPSATSVLRRITRWVSSIGSSHRDSSALLRQSGSMLELNTILAEALEGSPGVGRSRALRHEDAF